MGWLWRPWIFFVKWIAPVAIIAIILQQSELIDIDTIFGNGKLKNQESGIESFSFCHHTQLLIAPNHYPEPSKVPLTKPIPTLRYLL